MCICITICLFLSIYIHRQRAEEERQRQKEQDRVHMDMYIGYMYILHVLSSMKAVSGHIHSRLCISPAKKKTRTTLFKEDERD